tara:strand:+ start:45 stop:1688 length:1644 start_codon:yes stop_codon:yes gene_type:complete
MIKIKLFLIKVSLRFFPSLYQFIQYLKFHFGFKSKLSKQLSFKSSIPYIKKNDKRILIPAIETSHYQYHQIFILAKALELRGAKVKVLVCDTLLKGCEIKNVKNVENADPCLNCKFNQDHIIKNYGLDIILLSSIFSDEDIDFIKKKSNTLLLKDKKHFLGFDITRIVNESITRYFFGSNAQNKKEQNNITFNHLFTSILGFIAAKKINQSFKPNIILNNMNVYSSWEPYFNFFSQKPHVNLFTLQMSVFNYNRVLLNQMDLYYSTKRYQDYLGSRVNKNLSTSEIDELYNFINKRKKGDSKIFQTEGYYNKIARFEENLKFDEKKNNIFLFSNIFWDVGLSDTGRLYDGVINWVLDTIEIVSKIENSHLYVKIHPAEVFDSSNSVKGVKDYIYEKYPILPKNISIITPEMKINPTELFPYMDIAVLFNGTLGLEALFENIPVIATGKAPYSNLNLINEPINRTEYKNMLNGSVKLIIPKKNDYELFAYFYFIKCLIPWNLTKNAYADDFNGFNFNSLEDIMPSKDKYLDHLCNCILEPEKNIIENW